VFLPELPSLRSDFPIVLRRARGVGAEPTNKFSVYNLLHILHCLATSQSRQNGSRLRLIFIGVVLKTYTHWVMSIEQRGYGIEECCVLGFESATAFQNLIACLVFVIHDKKYSRKAAQLLICAQIGKVTVPTCQISQSIVFIGLMWPKIELASSSVNVTRASPPNSWFAAGLVSPA
jgi:hypothetical protein